MRTKTLLLTAALTAAGALTSMAQVYSVNIVGYINLSIPRGFSMIANQLNATPDNTLETLMPTMPEGTIIYKFNPALRGGLGAYDQYQWSADTSGWAPITANPPHPLPTPNVGESFFFASGNPARTWNRTFVVGPP